jgi:hypothetical protein
MKSFETYVAEGRIKESMDKKQVNSHMVHIEDLVIYGGVDGCRQAIVALRSLRDMLAGESVESHNITQKWDGAPAIFAGEDPQTGEFFIAKKGIFNKTPKVYKSLADVRADTSGDLTHKLSVAFTELSKLNIKGILQGDLLFTKDDLKIVKIEGRKYVTFHPNTLVYAVLYPSSDADVVLSANLGVVFHTSYTGATFDKLKAHYGADLSKLKQTSTAWVQTATLRDVSGSATLTAKQSERITSLLSRAGSLFRDIAATTLHELEAHAELPRMIETFENSYVRRGEKVADSPAHVRELIDWIHSRYAAEADKRKTEKGKAAVDAKKQEILHFFSPTNTASLVKMFDLRFTIVEIKEAIIKQLDKLNGLGTFVKTTKGYRTTGSEGFVAIDRLNGGAVKLVNRLEFSHLNFDPSIIKGWDK